MLKSGSVGAEETTLSLVAVVLLESSLPLLTEVGLETLERFDVEE